MGERVPTQGPNRGSTKRTGRKPLRRRSPRRAPAAPSPRWPASFAIGRPLPRPANDNRPPGLRRLQRLQAGLVGLVVLVMAGALALASWRLTLLILQL